MTGSAPVEEPGHRLSGGEKPGDTPVPARGPDTHPRRGRARGPEPTDRREGVRVPRTEGIPLSETRCGWGRERGMVRTEVSRRRPSPVTTTRTLVPHGLTPVGSPLRTRKGYNIISPKRSCRRDYRIPIYPSKLWSLTECARTPDSSGLWSTTLRPPVLPTITSRSGLGFRVLGSPDYRTQGQTRVSGLLLLAATGSRPLLPTRATRHSLIPEADGSTGQTRGRQPTPGSRALRRRYEPTAESTTRGDLYDGSVRPPLQDGRETHGESGPSYHGIVIGVIGSVCS